MNEYKTAVMELVLVIGKKAKRIKELEEENERLKAEYNDMIIDLAKARGYAQMLKNDLKDLSTEFNKWRNGKTEKKEKN